MTSTVQDLIALLEPFAKDALSSVGGNNCDYCPYGKCDLIEFPTPYEMHNRDCPVTLVRKRLAQLGYPMKVWRIRYGMLHYAVPTNCYPGSITVYSITMNDEEARKLVLAHHNTTNTTYGPLRHYRYVDESSIAITEVYTFNTFD